MNKENITYNLSKEEAEATIKDAEKGIKSSRGIMEAEFKDWWLGADRKGNEEVTGGAKKLAKWAFDQLFDYWNVFFGSVKSDEKLLEKAEKMKGIPENIEPHFKRLIEEVGKHGGQEHVWQYFMEEWRQDAKPEVREKIWKIYQKYMDNILGKV